MRGITVAVLLVLAAGCSGGDERPRAGATTTGATATVGSTAGLSTTSQPNPVTSITAAAATTTVAGGTTSVTGRPAVAEAGGWRLAINQPTAGGTVAAGRAVFCYEAFGTAREPDLILEVSASPPGVTARVPVTVGRSGALVDLSAAGTGVRELRVQLVVNGERISGLAVTIPAVTLASSAPSPACA